ncbi:RNB domain-containing ribonuclease [Paraconexibacter algicola]|uniref:Ribonuclease II n=1 Tax=Paraconexibacter algicola TaxID=2133960 RepID=A0A2T4UG97_9ACTN|nr:RNB domain-containing ribonuclease [Paraconexibacter algicola]PTL58219.1 ribonuclease II [Paraconexibacter algicola]
MLRVPAPSTDLRAAFDAIRAELDVPLAFPAEVLAAAEEAVRAPLPARDLTDVPFFTIDPPGSMDLDQAMALERDGDGHRVQYAIADVPAFVALGSPLDAEARRRGVTIYAPDGRTPLHPPVLSEDAASLLPDRERPAFVWDLRLDGRGVVTSATVARARVRSRARHDYASVQATLDAGGAPEELVLLREIGERRIALERERGGAELPMPAQEIEEHDGRYALVYRPQVPVEDHNAQISLMTGSAAAQLMLDGGIGILRTMPPPAEEAVGQLRRQARALGVAWPDGVAHGAFLRSLDLARPEHVAIVHAARRLFRGAAYTAFDGTAPTGDDARHAGVAAPYAHVTAPLRRLVDRFGLLVCAALCAGEPVPEDLRAALPLLPDLMRAADRRASSVERACLDAVEAAVLAPRAGETFRGVVVGRDDRGAQVQLHDPAVVAPLEGDVQLGDELDVRLVEADVARRVVRFAAA